MVKMCRWLKHSLIPPWTWRYSFTSEVLIAIENAVKQSEAQHRGELRFAVENSLAPGWVWHGMSGRHRATQVFSNLRVWDTDENCGVLIYVLLADREVHILADRGINRRVAQTTWDNIAHDMQLAYARSDFKGGSLSGIAAITQLLAVHFPAASDNINELSDKPVIIKRE